MTGFEVLNLVDFEMNFQEFSCMMLFELSLSKPLCTMSLSSLVTLHCILLNLAPV